MTRDLEETLAELGDGYRPLVDRLCRAYDIADGGNVSPAHAFPRFRPVRGFRIAAIAAASVLVALVTSALLFRGGDAEGGRVYSVRASDAANEYLLAIVRDDKAVQEMIRTQRPDGSWANDFLTRQNAAALRLCPGEKAQIAYRRAVRNLRLRHR